MTVKNISSELMSEFRIAVIMPQDNVLNQPFEEWTPKVRSKIPHYNEETIEKDLQG